MVPNNNWKTMMMQLWSSSTTSSSSSNNIFMSSLSLREQGVDVSYIQQQQQQQHGLNPVIHPEDSNLYCIPNDLSPIYKALPILLRVGLGIVTTYLVSIQSIMIKSTIDIINTSIQWKLSSILLLPIRFLKTFLFNNRWIKQYIYYELLTILIKSLALYIIISAVVQDLIPKYRPSRISASNLMNQYNNTLPSIFSQYHNLNNLTASTTVGKNYDPSNTSIHYLMKRDDLDSTDIDTDDCVTHAVIYLNHGFGASSLSWLPTIPVLYDQLNVSAGTGTLSERKKKTILGHDAPGFGLTDRLILPSSNDTDSNTSVNDYYTIQNSARIGTTLLSHYLQQMKQCKNDFTGLSSSTNQRISSIDQSKAKNVVVLIGHSLGSLTTLQMALQLHQQTNTTPIDQMHIILVAPALGFRVTRKTKRNLDLSDTSNNDESLFTSPITSTRSSQNAIEVPTTKRFSIKSRAIRTVMNKLIRRPVQRIGSSIVYYGLNRLVCGDRNFWKRGLSLFVWGNPKNVRSSDVLRYQWPAIIQNWEYGLLQFALSQVRTATRTDQELVQAVLNIPNITVDVVIGSNDRIIPHKSIQNFLTTYNFSNRINVTIMNGLGHDPFEEDPIAFVETIQSLMPAVE